MACKPHASGPPARLAGAAETLRALLAESHDRTNAELAVRRSKRHGLPTSAAVSRALTRWGLTRKHRRW